MSDQPARVHNHLSNRAKVRSALERKPIFKSVLENPFQIKWPSVPMNVQNLFLARLMAACENIPSRVHASRAVVRKGAISPAVNPSFKLPGTDAQASDDVGLGNLPAPDGAPSDYRSSPSQHLIIGINQVTRALERQLQFSRRRITLCTSSQCVDQPDVPPSNMAIVFVCCADLDPPVLVDHIPYLVAGCNSAKNAPPTVIRLVPLPKGSEAIISQTIGLRRAAVIGIDHASPLAAIFQDLLGSVQVVSASWLCPSDAKSAQRLVPTHIKQLCTTAPKNMKVAKEQRSKARAAAKTKSQRFSRSVRRKPRMTLTTGAADTS
ncbi:hypothetical protein PAXRUDRAFT_212549 [Paxillus rubicundulus Ve08.2h10]|uniref:Uncharacterized protein n=1 Tax=Paxillus rubicundulus Ve08.2h10 TaxID=930991 RepID=A0A0D0DHA8_9AGAM|nr:hypothetical protein PAXRUDRAFT_212549 [Paxillus rubicundulus Ve08.2h10]